MTAPQLGWLDTIVNVHWADGFFVVVDIKIGDGGFISASASHGVQTVYHRKDDRTTTPAPETFWYVWLPTQSQHFATNPQDQFIACQGHVTYFDVGLETIGYVDVDTAVLNEFTDNGIIDAFYNTGAHTSTAHSAFGSFPSDLSGVAGFSGFSPGVLFDATSAAAFASALTSAGGSSTIITGPYPVGPDPFNPICQVITGDPPTDVWTPTWNVGSIVRTSGPTTIHQFVEAYKVAKPAKGKLAPVASFSLTGTTGWNTYETSFGQAKHKVDPNKTSDNPYGASDGQVWMPITPANDRLDRDSSLDSGGTRTLYIDSNGRLSVV